MLGNNSAVRHCSDVSNNRFDLVSTSTPRDTNGLVKISGHNTVHDFNFNTI